MAWNPPPEVGVARDAARALNANRCVVIWTNEHGELGAASYGRTKALCDETKALLPPLSYSAQDWFATPAPEDRT